MKYLILILMTVGGIQFSQAQFLEKLGDKAVNAAERTVERRVEKEASKKTDEAMDEVFEGKKKKSKKEKQNDKKNKGNDSGVSSSGAGQGSSSVNTAKDFVRGNKVIFHEQFTKDVIGDFPGTWNTNSSGEVVTFGNENTRWLKMTDGIFLPEGLNSIPNNSTLEMDIAYEHRGVGKIFIQLVALDNKAKDFTQWQGTYGRDGKNGVVLYLAPFQPTNDGNISLHNRIDGSKVLETPYKKITQFTANKKSAHLSFWRQDNRLRVYLDDEKIFDLPKAFADKNYNSLVFTAAGQYYVSNIILATDAGADTRHKLLETGSFTTNDILFDSGKSTLQPSSYSVLDEIGEIMKSNPSKHLTITGHTDSDGAEAANQTLSEQRAQSVKKYFTDKFGLSGNQITTIGKGESQPVASGNSADAKAKNRRVEFTLN